MLAAVVAALVFLLLLASPAGGAGTSWLASLREQGVSESRILGYDANGIPEVCGTGAPGEVVARPALGATGLPAGTRGWETIPGVIRDDGVASFVLEVDTNGPVNGVSLHWTTSRLIHDPTNPTPFGATIELRDDGVAPDRAAGDFVFTTRPIVWNVSTPVPVTTYLDQPDNPDGIDIAELGAGITIEESDTSKTHFREGPEVGVVRSDLVAAPTIVLSSEIQASAHVVNVRTSNRETQLFLRGLGGNPSALTNALYAFLPDGVHQWLLFSTSKIERLPSTSAANFVAGIHRRVRTDFTGTGLYLSDVSDSYGSDGVLMSVNALDSYTRGLNSANATHELMHQWSAYLSSSLGIKSDSAHWASWSNAASLLGGFLWIDNGDGTYSVDCSQGRNGATSAPPIDLYLAGLIEGSAVPPLHVAPSVGCGGTVHPADITATATIEDIQALHGVRDPGPASSQKTFRVGFIAESHDRLLDATEMTFYETLAEAYMRPVPNGTPDPYQGGLDWVSMTRFLGPEADFQGAVVTCGNGTLELAEECDDGNFTDGDGCSALCAIELPAVVRIEVYDTDLPPDEGFVKVLEEGDILSRAEVGSCPGFHTVTNGPRDNSNPESLEGTFTSPSGVHVWNETTQPYCWPGDQGWFDPDAGIPACWCRDGLTTEDGAYSITVTPYDGELVGGDPTGNPGQGLSINFYVPEPSRWLLLAAGLGCLAVLYRARGQ